MSSPNPRERGEGRSSALPSPRDMCLGHPRTRPWNSPQDISPETPTSHPSDWQSGPLGMRLVEGQLGGQPHPTAAFPSSPPLRQGFLGTVLCVILVPGGCCRSGGGEGRTRQAAAPGVAEMLLQAGT